MQFGLFVRQQLARLRSRRSRAFQIVDAFRQLVRDRLGLDQGVNTETGGRLLRIIEDSAASLRQAFSQVRKPLCQEEPTRRNSIPGTLQHSNRGEYSRRNVLRGTDVSETTVAPTILSSFSIRTGHIRIAIHSDETAVRPALIRLWVSGARLLSDRYSSDLEVQLAASYFNPRLECFEPLVEPFNAKISVAAVLVQKRKRRQVLLRASTEDPVRVVVSPTFVRVVSTAAAEATQLVKRVSSTWARVSKNAQEGLSTVMRGMDPRRLSSSSALVHVRNLGAQAIHGVRLNRRGGSQPFVSL